jgi:anthranilate 1,2-dioxygenase large subunit
MEDGESTELCQKAIVRDGEYTSVIEMDGKEPEGAKHLVTEGMIRSMWQGYREMMGF